MGRNPTLWAALVTVSILLVGLFATLSENSAEAASISPPAPMVTATPVATRLNADEYLALLPTLNPPERNPSRVQTDFSSVDAGPANLALSRIFSGRGSNDAQLWIEASFADIPNLALLPRSFAHIEIERVQRADGVNIHVNDNNLATLSLEYGGPHGAATAVRSVKIARNAKRDDVAYVTGKVALDLPIGVQAFALSKNEMGIPQIADTGTSVELITLHDNTAVFSTTGRPEAYITIYGYDSSGNRLAAVGESVSAVSSTVQRTAVFRGQLDHVEVIFAEGYLTKKYPFVLKGPGARLQQSIGKPPTVPTGPVIVKLPVRPQFEAA